MVGSYFVALKDEPDEAKRFVVSFNGTGDVTFGPRPAGRLSSTCASIVDYMQGDANVGKRPAFFANTVTEDWGGNTVYQGRYFRAIKAQAKVAPKAKGLAKCIKIFDGTWRVVPEMQLKSGGYVVPYAIIFKGEPYSGYFSGQTKQETFDKIFLGLDKDDPDDIRCALLKTLKMASQEQIDAQIAENAPPTEYVPSQAELNAATITSQELNKIPAEVVKLRYISDPLFKAACDKLWESERLFAAKLEQKQREEDQKAAAAAAKRKLAEMQQ